MTVTEADIPKVSPYSVTAAGPFTPERFTLFKAVAEEQLQREGSTLPPALYDYCHALLIVHHYVVARGQAGIASQTIGGLSFTRSGEVDEYLTEYRDIIEKNAAPAQQAAPDGEAQRSDASMPAFRLDRSGGYY